VERFLRGESVLVLQNRARGGGAWWPTSVGVEVGGVRAERDRSGGELGGGVGQR
jgi:hypothetical protein